MPLTDESSFEVEVVYATATRQELVSIRVNAGATVADAIDLSGISALFPGAAIGDCSAGIWGRPVDRGQVLSDGDRIEIYRPLEKDPREARRDLAASGMTMGRRDGH